MPRIAENQTEKKNGKLKSEMQLGPLQDLHVLGGAWVVIGRVTEVA